MPDATPRKPNGRAGVEGHGRRLPLRPVRKEIWEAAQSLIGTGRSISITLAERFRIPPATVEAVLLSEGVRHERTAAALRTGIVNALQLARDVVDESERAVA